MSFSRAFASPIGKVGIYCGLFLAGDYGAQKIGQYQQHRRWDLPVCREDLKFTAGWSLLMGGPMVYKWYTYIDHPQGFKKSRFGQYCGRLGPITGAVKLPMGLILGKIVVDLLFDVPLYGSYLYTKNLYTNRVQYPLTQSSSYLQPFNWSFAKKSADVYQKDLYCWTPANFIGFFFVPDRYRIPYVSTVTAIWACCLPLICDEKH